MKQNLLVDLANAAIGLLSKNYVHEKKFTADISKPSLIRICYILSLVTGLFSCDSKTLQSNDEKLTDAISRKITDEVKFHHLKKLFVVGDFDGDDKTDTVFQHTFSLLTNSEIENSPDPFGNDWDVVTKWFYDQEADVYLTSSTYRSDTVHFGVAQGLYCLLNIGDNNADNKDEIALVVDRCDFSMVNSCAIYSLCAGKWTELKYFQILENAFFVRAGEPLVFENINGYLERKNGIWVYFDNELRNHQEVSMTKLTIETCSAAIRK